jgi:hypothetical protein
MRNVRKAGKSFACEKSVRRSLSTGRKALAYALLYPKAGRGKKNDSTGGIIFWWVLRS